MMKPTPSEVLRRAEIRAKDEDLGEVEAILLEGQADAQVCGAALNALDLARAQTWRRAIALAEALEEQGEP
ncbi:MAG: hypothetical protein V3U45_08350 [bacterium]